MALCLETPPLTHLSGRSPLPWWGAGHYNGHLRTALLQLRHRPDAAVMAALTAGLLAHLQQDRPGDWPRGLLLVPIPSWKRCGNPLPALLSRCLAAGLGGSQTPELLQRSRPVLGQHRLQRRQRWANQRHSFRALLPVTAIKAQEAGVLLVDDVLTSGATAMAAAEALAAAQWPVVGLLCLARTPRPRR
jgi:predicted amidophosphoribosyltransferase